MVEKDLIDKDFSEGDILIRIEGDDLIIKGKHESKGAKADLDLRINGEYFIDKLAEAIPGPYDDYLFKALKVAIKGL